MIRAQIRSMGRDGVLVRVCALLLVVEQKLVKGAKRKVLTGDGCWYLRSGAGPACPPVAEPRAGESGVKFLCGRTGSPDSKAE
jgi:hypothetical protein